MPNETDLTRGERLQIMLSPDELKAVDDFRYKKRMPSRAAAVRELFRLGLAAAGSIGSVVTQKSSDFGVLSIGPDDESDGSPRRRRK
jgi:hypothetical protein